MTPARQRLASERKGESALVFLGAKPVHILLCARPKLVRANAEVLTWKAPCPKCQCEPCVDLGAGEEEGTPVVTPNGNQGGRFAAYSLRDPRPPEAARARKAR